MRRQLIMSFLGFLVMLTSCQKESGNLTGGVAAIDYLPSGTGAKWNYHSTSTGDFTVNSLGTDSLINGLKYFKFNRISNGTSSRFYTNKTNAVYRQYAYFPQASQVIEMIVLKDSAIGTSWTNTINVSGFSNYHKYTVTAKDIQRIVNGTTYSKVIELNYQLLVDNPLGFGPPINAGTGKNYYAKGIGEIESYYTIGFLGINIKDTTRLISYTSH